MVDFVALLVFGPSLLVLVYFLGLIQRRPADGPRVPLRRQLPPVVSISDNAS